MDILRKGCTKNVILKSQPIKIKRNLLNDIHEEYCLKQNKFNPSSPSPNVFMSKLKWRMKEYYKELSNSPK